jgi:hypothetical protein
MDRLPSYVVNNFANNNSNNMNNNLNLDYIFKNVVNSDDINNGNTLGDTSNDSILLLNQNIERLKQTFGNPNQLMRQPLSNSMDNNMLNNIQLSSTTSNSPSIDSSYGSFVNNSNLNGALTPPPDNGYLKLFFCCLYIYI